jgi:hypothetical protein
LTLFVMKGQTFKNITCIYDHIMKKRHISQDKTVINEALGMNIHSFFLPSFLPSFLYLTSFLPTHCTCTELSLPLVTLHDTHTHTHKDRPSQRPLSDNTQHSQQTSMLPARFEPPSPSQRAAVDPCFRPHGHCVTPVPLATEKHRYCVSKIKGKKNHRMRYRLCGTLRRRTGHIMAYKIPNKRVEMNRLNTK